MKKFIQTIRRVMARSLREPAAYARQHWELDLLLTVFLGTILLALTVLFID